MSVADVSPSSLCHIDFNVRDIEKQLESRDSGPDYMTDVLVLMNKRSIIAVSGNKVLAAVTTDK